MHDHAGANRMVGDAVDKNECAGRLVFRVRVERNRRLCRDVADADLVQFQRLRGLAGKGIDVDTVLQIGDRSVGLVRLCSQNVGSPRQQRLLVEPDDLRRELVGHLGPPAGRNQHVAA